MSRPAAPTGLRAVAGEHLDLIAALGGWRAMAETTAPTLLFVLVTALAPLCGVSDSTTVLLWTLAGAVGVCALAALARLAARSSVTGALQGLVLVLISAAWSWRTGQARDFYATGLAINAVWMAVIAVSLIVGKPLVTVLVRLWLAAGARDKQDGSDDERAGDQPSGCAHAPARTGPQGGGELARRGRLATYVLGALFALRLAVELPLYLAGESAVTALGLARLVLGLPAFAVALWAAWTIMCPCLTHGPSGQ